MDTASPITHVSLCAGYGGIDLGLKRAIPSLRTIAFSEIEGFACANLVSKMEAGLLDPAPIWTDLKTFPWAEFHGRVDILSGGYPCQPFSAAGKRLGAEDPRHLWPFIAAGIAAMRPAACFFENVEGHISLGLPDVIEDLGRLGYRTTWGVFSASEVGAPHQRKRIFILAHCHNARQLQHALRFSDGEEYASTGSCGAWPARPGEQQFEWEPPRVVVGNASSARHARTAWSGGACAQGQSIGYAAESDGAMGHTNSARPQVRPRQQRAGIQGADADGGEAAERQAQSSLGRDADGPTHRLDDAVLHVTTDNRTDELRLLGNGVVPATAERAFRVLFSELTAHNTTQTHP